MAWLSMSLRVLAAVVAVVVVETEMQRVAEAGHRADDSQEQETETFVLSSDVHSQLFSHCMDEKNTVEGSMYSIQVDGEIKYVRFDASGNDRNILWETESDVASTVGCAFRAHERGALMFKFTRAAGCQLALDDVYDRSQPSCEGSEIVYVINLIFCFEDGQYYRVGETTDEDCRRECTDRGILVGPEGFDFGSLNSTCCPASSTPCWAVTKGYLDNRCKALDWCGKHGLVIPSVEDPDDAKRVFELQQAVSDRGEAFRYAWVDVFKDNDGVWRHGASRNAVDDSLWGPGELSNPGKCAVATDMNYIKPVRCTDGFNSICQGPEEDIPECIFSDTFVMDIY